MDRTMGIEPRQEQSIVQQLFSKDSPPTSSVTPANSDFRIAILAPRSMQHRPLPEISTAASRMTEEEAKRVESLWARFARVNLRLFAAEAEPPQTTTSKAVAHRRVSTAAVGRPSRLHRAEPPRSLERPTRWPLRNLRRMRRL